jgi:hypothetical protein
MASCDAITQLLSLLFHFLFYLFFVVRFGDARFWDDFTRVDMSSRQIRQFMDPCESTLGKQNKTKRGSVSEMADDDNC